MKDWPLKKVGDICEFKYGKNLPEATRIAGSYPVYGSSSIVSYHSESLVKGPGIIVGRKGTVGKVQFSKGDFFPIDTTFYITTKASEADMKFLYYRLGLCGFQEMNSDAAVPGLNRSAALSVKLKVPPLDTQLKISNILSAYDDLIENNLKRIKLLEELAEATYEEWFIRMLFPNHENMKVDSETGLPEGWMIKLNKDCCNVSGGGTPSTTINEYWENGDVTWFSPTDLSKSKSLFLSASASKITKAGLKGSSAKLLGKNSFMMTSRATIGLFGLVDNDFCTNQGFINITPFKKEHKYFLLYNLKSRVPEFLNYASGATFLELSKSKFNSLKTVWPNESVINRFHELCEPVIQLVINLTKENDRLKEARDILLPRLMTGVIDVDELMKETA